MRHSSFRVGAKKPRRSRTVGGGRKRILGEHFNRDGTPKKSFGSQKAAIKFIDQNPKQPLKAYRCEFCKKWHVATVK